MYDNEEEQQCRLNKCVIILTTATCGFILLASFFSMNSNSQIIILQQASAALDIKQSEGMQVSAAISSDTNQLMKSAGLGDGPATTTTTIKKIQKHR
jgi:hypothetical protein